MRMCAYGNEQLMAKSFLVEIIAIWLSGFSCVHIYILFYVCMLRTYVYVLRRVRGGFGKRFLSQHVRNCN